MRQFLIRTAGSTALAIALVTGGATALAQDETAVPVNVPAVDLHAGTCNNYVLEPEAEIADPERQNYFEATGELAEDIDDEFDDLNDNGLPDIDEPGYLDEDLDDDGVLDEGEDLNDNGVLDVGFDADNDGILDDDEILTVDEDEAAVVVVDPPTVWKGEGEIDADFDELFDEQKAILVHQSGIDYETIIACGNVNAIEWEDEDQVVIGLHPVDNSGYYGYAVLERDTGNIPVFGENTTGVTIYLFQGLPSQRDAAMMGTPTP